MYKINCCYLFCVGIIIYTHLHDNLEIQFSHCLKEGLFPPLCSQLQHFLRVTGIQFWLPNGFYLDAGENSSYCRLWERDKINKCSLHNQPNPSTE